MIYIDYEYYTNNYSGRMITETDFAYLSRKASAYLDTLTLGRITEGWKTDERVKNACCAVAEVYALKNAGGEVASETNDGASITYVTSGKSTAQRLADAAAIYLSSTGLLYRGID